MINNMIFNLVYVIIECLFIKKCWLDIWFCIRICMNIMYYKRYVNIESV